MPESPTANMGLIKPTENSDTGNWDGLLNDCLDAVDAHNHTAGNGARIPSAGININANLELNGYALTEGGAIYLNDVTALSSGLRGIFSTSGNLYWRNGSGTNVQLTSGSSLNASLLGGFAGDYASVSAQADYTDSTDTYAFRQQVGASVRQYARGAFGGVDLYEYKAHPTGTVPTTRVRLESPTALAASYTLTMPAATPGSTSLVQVSSTGTLTFSNTMASLPRYTTAVRHSLNYWGAHLTGTAGFSSTSTSGKNLVLGSGGVAYIEVPYVDNEIIANVQVVATAAGIGSITAELYEYLPATGTTTLIASGSNTTTTPTTTFTITPGSTFYATGGNKLTLLVYSSSGATNNVFAIDVNKRTA